MITIASRRAYSSSWLRVGRDGKPFICRILPTMRGWRRRPELVAQTYDYLRHVPETAAILGWEESVDETHLEERRRFFTVWLARTLGLDTSDEFAHYLFRAGKFSSTGC